MSSKDPTSDYNAALALKDAGNASFKVGDYKAALKSYSRIFMHIGMNPCMNMSQVMNQSGKPSPASASTKDPLQQKTDALRVTAFNNMAAVYAKMQKWDDCKEKCTRVLKHDEKNTKALFRRGMAHRKLNLYEASRADLEKAREILNSSDAAIERELKLLDKDEKNADKEFYAKMKKQMQKAQKKKKQKQKIKQDQLEAKLKEEQIEKNKDKNPNIKENLNSEQQDEFVWDIPKDNDNNNDKNNKNDDNNNGNDDKNKKNDQATKDANDDSNNNKNADKNKKNIEQQPSEF